MAAAHRPLKKLGDRMVYPSAFPQPPSPWPGKHDRPQGITLTACLQLQGTPVGWPLPALYSEKGVTTHDKTACNFVAAHCPAGSLADRRDQYCRAGAEPRPGVCIGVGVGTCTCTCTCTCTGVGDCAGTGGPAQRRSGQREPAGCRARRGAGAGRRRRCGGCCPGNPGGLECDRARVVRVWRWGPAVGVARCRRHGIVHRWPRGCTRCCKCRSVRPSRFSAGLRERAVGGGSGHPCRLPVGTPALGSPALRQQSHRCHPSGRNRVQHRALSGQDAC